MFHKWEKLEQKKLEIKLFKMAQFQLSSTIVYSCIQSLRHPGGMEYLHASLHPMGS